MSLGTIFSMFPFKKRNFHQKNIFWEITTFFNSPMIKFCKTDKVKGIPLSKIFINNLKGIITTKIHLHHSHITGEIIGYNAHSFCKMKVRENKYKITVVAHNLFRFDFFFYWKVSGQVSRELGTNIGGKNPTDINFANIGNQIPFLNTIK